MVQITQSIFENGGLVGFKCADSLFIYSLRSLVLFVWHLDDRECGVTP